MIMIIVGDIIQGKAITLEDTQSVGTREAADSNLDK
jgi:hypothetical protein